MAAESALKRLLIQVSHYSLASLFTMVAGLVTFPLLTRIFAPSDYGVMSLIAATITVAVAVGKLGVQHSIVRYQSEISVGKGQFTLPQLYSTTLFGMLGSGALVALAVAASTQVLPARWLGDERLRGLLVIASSLIVIQVVESAFVNLLRAEQLTSAFMRYQVVKKALSLGFILVTVLVISRQLPAFYTASMLSEVVAVGLLSFWLFRGSGRALPSPTQFSAPLYKDLLKFGIPMAIGYELSGIILSVGDRYVIAGLIGETPLGVYAAAYNLCQYVQAVLIASVGQAIMPVYIKLWDEKGVDAAAAFISRSLRTYTLLAAPVIAGLASVGPELLPSLASEEYASAAVILPWVIAGMVVDGTNSMVGAGLFIHRKTRTIMAIVLTCAALNIALNLILVPRMGILGSAVATLACYLSASMSLAIAGRRLLPVKLPWATLLRAAAAAVLMYLGLQYVVPGRRMLTVGVRLAVGVPSYGLVMLLIDPDARAMVRKVLDKLRPRGGRR